MGATVEYHPNSARDQSRLHEFGKKVFLGILLGYVLIAGGKSKGHILVADIEELGKLDASEIHARFHYSLSQMEQQNFVEEIMDRESTPWQYHPVRSEDLRGEFQGNSDGSQPTEAHDDAEARNDFWSIEGDFIYRHHTEPRVHLYEPKEETFPIRLKYIDVTRTTHTNLDVLQEKHINDIWIVDVDRNLSDSWIHEVHVVE